MYLKEIITSGFKSFADKLDLKLDDKITCIVGPNGSGKSNVVDAVRWVLGEQSVKSLRGEGSMSDVIFSGSKSRNSLNIASVELIFDNSDHFLNVPYTEISIKRRVYRSGENEYYLNNDKCRLKDITNLLMDTGMGKESFNIISQGEVERILSDSPVERRIIFEEAAGVLKYKKRKEEALRKLDRTHNNLDRVNDIINELELQISPLKEQSDKAKVYLENKEGLDKYEVALLAYDIENYNHELELKKLEKEKIDNDILKTSNSSTKEDALLLEKQSNLIKIEKQESILNNKLTELTGEVERINGEKNLLIERSKTTKEENEIREEIRKLLEQEASIKGNIEVVKLDLDQLITSSKKIDAISNDIKKNISSAKDHKNMLSNDYSKLDRELISTKHKIDSLSNEIENGGVLPNSVKSLLNEVSLRGIHNTIGNILNTSDEYVKALDIAISSTKNFVITEDENSAKQAINYLKDNHLGRATFFPLTVIKGRYVDTDTLKKLKNNSDFIDVLSNLVTFEKSYKNIVENQLGTVLVSKDIDSATRLSHSINARYKVVTLDGDTIHVGGSMSGGSTYQTKSIISLKQDLKHLKEHEKILINELKEISEEASNVNTSITKLEDEYFNKSRTKVNLKEQYDSKVAELNELEKTLKVIINDKSNLDSISNKSVDEKELQLIKLYHEKNTEKETASLELNNLKEEKEELKESIEKIIANDKLVTSTIRNLEKDSRDIDIIINRLDLKLDNMLNILNSEYEMTYEKAKDNYKLDIDPEEARTKVNLYKANIKRIGMVNLDSIEEYERVNSRYVFLNNQKEDLLKAEETLLEIMNEMDDVIKEEFKISFELIREQFKVVFKELFGGGNADLKLTNPNELLTTGVEIVASPPGKKLTTISLLSGGEKTLTAISLLFAILNVRNVPFCLFDEVEAALDEANVIQFGKYLEHYKDKTQFLIITHKKKTMEYANTLYGITMQESGVSKLVSVKLSNYVETL